MDITFFILTEKNAISLKLLKIIFFQDFLYLGKNSVQFGNPDFSISVDKFLTKIEKEGRRSWN